ncbi:hypothetical protein CC1G_01185 [Coprinopsis cinerea okayama7|uniref:Uncharacterized protein n=1 Tax=Coprinopsis cinerea (strain Okayama-7 / 130 / ATCC MYA-4618 / FGSC 9003) TaxID=240176 RepID=A8NET5_COPC7|nr:hypothetical protein CC1G_01185 [Coprinopsis cinerea okayama7\|eukprot:XP_001833123.2 hypothetical protein CC1G_01185 [Coprinopsis cinerea okayama7\
MSTVVVPTGYDQDIQPLNPDLMATNTINPESLLTPYPEILPSQSFQPALDTNSFMPKQDQSGVDIANDVQPMAEDTPTMYMSIAPMPVDTIDPVSGLQSLSPPYATEIVPESAFPAIPPPDTSSLSMELSGVALSTPSPPAMPNGAMLGAMQAGSPTGYSVATTSSLDAALIPTVPLTSPTRSSHSVSPISVPSPFGTAVPQSPSAPGVRASPEEDTAALNEEVPIVQQKGKVVHMIETMMRDLYAAKDVVQRADVNENDLRDLLQSKMNLISRMAANLSLGTSQETTPPPPSLPAFVESQMTGISELPVNGGYSNHPPTGFDPTAHVLVSDQSRKRTASEMDADIGMLKREPPEDAPLVLPNSVDPLSLPPVFPATSAIPLSSQVTQSRPGTRPPTPQSASFSTSQSFVSPPMSPYTMTGPLGKAPVSIGPHQGPSNPSFASVRPGWPEQTPPAASRHHHSLSTGSIGNPMQLMLSSMPSIPIHPGLASGPTTPITVNPPMLNRTSRSGSLSNMYDPAFNFYNSDISAEPPLKKAALGTRSARNSSVGSNWYFGGGDVSSPSNTSEEPTTTRNTPSDDDGDRSTSESDENDQESPAGNGAQSSISDSTPVSSASTASDIPQEYRAEVDRIFFEYLNKICSNLDAKDGKGDHIHQTLMAKKMQRLDESPDFRPFKFRIQAFTSAFLEELARQGYPEDKIPMKKVRNYLWHQPHILRFNEDGKKAKSKGNHIWNVEARKLGESRWEFRPFQRKLAGSPPTIAYCGLKWTWTPRIWDPQASFTNVPVTYSSPNLPSWLSWKDDVLSGIPPADAESCTITVIAKYILDGVEGQLTRTLPITIAPVSSVENNAYPRSRRPSVSEAPPRRSTSDSALFQAPQRAAKVRAAAPSVPIPVPGESSSNRVIRVLQTVAQRVNEEAHNQFASPENPKVGQLQEMAKSKQVLEQTVEAMDKELAGQAQMETKRLAIAAQQVVIQAAANVIADRNVSIGRAPVVPNKSTAVQRVSVNELSDATHDAIVQAVKTNGPASTEVDIIVTAASILKAQAPVGEPHPPSTAITRPPTLPTPYLHQNLPPLPEYT